MERAKIDRGRFDLDDPERVERNRRQNAHEIESGNLKNPVTKLPTRHFSPPRAPAGLGQAGRKLWREIQREYLIVDPGGITHLTSACQAADDLARMRAVVEKDGNTLLDRFGQVMGHPLLIAIARMESVKRLALAALCLDLEPLKGVGRPSEK